MSRVAIVVLLILAAAAAAFASEPAPVRLAPRESRTISVEIPAGQYALAEISKSGSDLQIQVSCNGATIDRLFSIVFSTLPVQVPMLAPENAPANCSLVLKNAGSTSLEIRLAMDGPRVPTEADRARYAADRTLQEARLLPRPSTKEQMEAAYRKAIEQAKGAGDPVALALAWRYLGQELMQRQDFGGAEACLRENLALVERENALFEESAVRNDLSFVLRMRGQLGDALAEENQVLSLRRKMNDDYGLALGLFGRGAIHWEAGDLQAALDDDTRSLAEWRKLHERRWEADTLNALGLVEADVGRPTIASAEYEEALAIWQALNDKAGRMRTINNAGLLEESLGHHQRARERLDEALSIADNLKDTHSQGYILQNLGDVAAAEHQLQQASDEYQLSLAIKRQLGDLFGEAETNRKLGLNEMAAGNLEVAHSNLSVSLDQTIQTGDREGEVQTRAALARLAQRQKNVHEAEQQIASAISLIETARLELRRRELRVSYFARKRELYDLAADLADSPGGSGITAAFEWSERGRARALADAVARANGVSASQPPPSVKSIQESLEPGTVLVEYSSAPDRTVAWVVRSNSIRTARLPGAVALAGAMLAFDRSLHDSQTGHVAAKTQLSADLARLAKMVWYPLQVGPAKRIIIAAEGDLERLPFAALPVSPQGSPLLTRSEIVLTPSAAFAFDLRPDSSRLPASVAIFADPVDSTRQLPPLAFSREEAQQISRYFPSNSVQLELACDATAPALRRTAAEPHGILHIASHAIAADDASQTRLVLSSCEGGQPTPVGEEDAVYLDDIYRMHVASPLVVLSSCDSATGSIARGEGMLSLARAFLYSGAKTLVASLWKTDDRATYELMWRFYRNLAARGMPAAAALRSAELELRRDSRWSGMQYWAAFSTFGDGSARLGASPSQLPGRQ